jgi:hypothetical protein
MEAGLNLAGVAMVLQLQDENRTLRDQLEAHRRRESEHRT